MRCSTLECAGPVRGESFARTGRSCRGTTALCGLAVVPLLADHRQSDATCIRSPNLETTVPSCVRFRKMHASNRRRGGSTMR